MVFKPKQRLKTFCNFLPISDFYNFIEILIAFQWQKINKQISKIATNILNRHILLIFF